MNSRAQLKRSESRMHTLTIVVLCNLFLANQRRHQTCLKDINGALSPHFEPPCVCAPVFLSFPSCLVRIPQGAGERRRRNSRLLGGNARLLLLQRRLQALQQRTDVRHLPARRDVEQPQQDPAVLRLVATENPSFWRNRRFLSPYFCS